MIRILFGASLWMGADGRSFRDALMRRDDVVLDDIDFDHFFAHRQHIRLLRGAYRFLAPLQQRSFETELLARCRGFRPDAIIVFKGAPMTPDLIGRLQAEHCPVFNIWPDVSPKVHTPRIARTMGCYDAVFSTKARHGDCWQSEYGYTNRCLIIDHGYDPILHYRPAPVENPSHDLVLIGNGRQEYAALLHHLAQRFGVAGLRVAIGGTRWDQFLPDLPEGWDLIGPQLGAAYTEWLRRGKIVLAPVQRHLEFNGIHEPGDEVSARSFECAGAHVFFIHSRSPGAQAIFDEATEVPMFDTAEELGDKVAHYLDRPDERAAMAAAAHARAVPAYSHDARAAKIVEMMGTLL